MSSELQKLSRAVLALAKENGGVSTEVFAAAVRLQRLTDAASAIRLPGISTGALIAELQQAARHIEIAARHVETIRSEGESFAAHLASGSSRSGHGGVRAAVDGIMTAAAIMGTPAASMMATVNQIHDLHSGDGNRTSEILRALGSDTLEQADDLKDLSERDVLRVRPRRPSEGSTPT